MTTATHKYYTHSAGINAVTPTNGPKRNDVLKAPKRSAPAQPDSGRTRFGFFSAFAALAGAAGGIVMAGTALQALVLGMGGAVVGWVSSLILKPAPRKKKPRPRLENTADHLPVTTRRSHSPEEDEDDRDDEGAEGGRVRRKRKLEEEEELEGKGWLRSSLSEVGDWVKRTMQGDFEQAAQPGQKPEEPELKQKMSHTPKGPRPSGM